MTQTPPHHLEDHGHGNGHGHAHAHGHDHGHDFSPERIARLVNDEREAEMPPEATLRAIGLATGMTVIDLGCGPGFFTIAARAIVGDTGRVIAADVQPEMLDYLRDRLTQVGITDVTYALATENAVPVETGIADLVLVALVVHEVDDPGAFLVECARLTKPNGTVAVIELVVAEDIAVVPPHRITTAAVVAHGARAGLTSHTISHITPDRVLVRLRRP